MIKFSVFYPNAPEARFDLAYYQTRHVPLVAARCGPALARAEIERGLSGAEPGSSPPFVIAGHLFFESAEAMQEVLSRHMTELAADIPNFTNVQPTVQISEVLT